MAITCIYCAGAHETPGEVRACWERSAGTSAPPRSASPATPRSSATPPRSTPSGAAPASVPFDARPGPPQLGRNVLIRPGADVPDGWRGAPRLRIDAATLITPAEALGVLRRAARDASPVVIEVDGDPASTTRERNDRPPYEIGPRHEFELDAVVHLATANAIDLRDPSLPRWPLLERAAALGAVVGGSADVALPDGTPVWLDGGPVRYLPPIDGAPVLHAVSVEHGNLVPPVGNDTTADLASDQLAAVTHPTGAARIIAPAGSGKTRVLTERARHLLTRWRLPPGAVCLVAFNKRAQEEMRERTPDLPALQVRTLNSIALAIVNGDPPYRRQPERLRTIDEPEVRRLLGGLVKFPKRRNADPVAPWIEALGLIRLGLVAPLEAETRYGGEVGGLAQVWPRYREALSASSTLDFDEQIYRALEILLTQPAARAAAQRACRVMLVDEFQDLTPAHVLLVRLLAAPGGAVFGVGDDDQTIYGYNGADPAWLIDFAELFPGAGEHPLEVNYRCPDGIVRAVDRLLRHNARRVPKTIRSASGDPAGLVVVTSDDPVDDTLGAVQGAIAAGAPTASIAVLTRVNALLAPVQAALSSTGVPIAAGVGLEFVERTAVRSVLAWLRLACGDRFAPADLGEALRRPSRPLHPRVAEWVAEQHDTASLRRLAGRLNEEREAERVESFADDVELMRQLARGGAPTLRLVEVLVDELGLAGSVASLDATRRGMNRSAQGDDLAAMRQLARLHESPAGFEAWLRSQLAVQRRPDGAVLATVHRVKGQEWPHVVVHLGAADQFPHRLADDVEEERRVFHVAVTRASRQATVVTGPRPSPFVAELSTEPPRVLRPVDRPSPATPTVARRDTRRDHPLLDRATVVAAPGLVIVDQGTEWVVREVLDGAVVAASGAAIRRFAIGSHVVTAGRQRGNLRLPADPVTPRAAVVFDELRRLRERVRNGKPAYTIFDDATLAGIASALPSTLDELRQVRGVGPAKIEQYGKDVLEVVHAAPGRA